MKYSHVIINIKFFHNNIIKLKRFFKQMDCFQAYHITTNFKCFTNLS